MHWQCIAAHVELVLRTRMQTQEFYLKPFLFCALQLALELCELFQIKGRLPNLTPNESLTVLRKEFLQLLYRVEYVCSKGRLNQVR